MPDPLPTPRQYKGVMISSTFSDLESHRSALIKAIKGQKLTDVAMENDTAKADVDVIDSSLQMVADGSAYIGVISHKYGQTPQCPERNPENLSLTELEFNEAQKLHRPILLFIMGDKHPVTVADVETDPAKIAKRDAFRERAKQMKPGSSVHRVYATFDSLEEFERKAIHAAANLRLYLDEQETPPSPEPDTDPDAIPAPPAFYAEPPYIGSHAFLGRQAELERLNDWAAPADPHPVILFEAIGGTGKSLLTWEWTTKHALQVRNDWAGRFWYSFYEKGAIMADFCRRALAYITGQPLEDFQKKKTVQLGEMLLRHLQERPWLLILDGLERVLVAYHRFDAAQLVDEEAGTSDQIAHRDPCAAIRPEDDDLLRALAAAAPSKLVLTSRLIPRVLLNQASQPIPGVLRVPLPGLRPADAEALLRSCGVTGSSHEIQDYLKSHCDCHPLVTGALAGLINDYLPDRGNFDAWADDPNYGGKLNLADLDLAHKRNHILHSALVALPEKSRQLLSTLALISEAVDYETLSALNPHAPLGAKEDKEPQNPTETRQWSADFVNAQHELTKSVRDLERRGLLQYDFQTKRHDLHPVVRGIAAGSLRSEEKQQYGQRVVDYFSKQTDNPYEQAETIEDLRNGLHVVRTLLQMGRYQEACNAYSFDLARALSLNLEAHAERLSLLRPFFPRGWSTMPEGLSEYSSSRLAYSAAEALEGIRELEEAGVLFGGSLVSELRRQQWQKVIHRLHSLSVVFEDLDCLAKVECCDLLALDIASLIKSDYSLFSARLSYFWFLFRTGQWEEAENLWNDIDGMGRDWGAAGYISGTLEYGYAHFRFYRGDLTEEHLTIAEQLVRSTRARHMVRSLYRLRGRWHIDHHRWLLAADCFRQAIRMAREIGQGDPTSEARLVFAKFHLNQLSDVRHEAALLAAAKHCSHQDLAELWFAIGDLAQAKKHALESYKQAWGEGKPYAWVYQLEKARDLLTKLRVEIPDLPPYDPSKVEKLPWKDELVAAIEKLREEKSKERDQE